MALKSIVAFLTIVKRSPSLGQTIRAIEEAMMQSKHILVAVTQRSIEIDNPQPKDFYETGTLVEVVTTHRQQDGSMQVLIRGIQRVTIDEFLDNDPFIRVRVTELQKISNNWSASRCTHTSYNKAI